MLYLFMNIFLILLLSYIIYNPLFKEECDVP